jgi:hypothetical protein
MMNNTATARPTPIPIEAPFDRPDDEGPDVGDGLTDTVDMIVLVMLATVDEVRLVFDAVLFVGAVKLATGTVTSAVTRLPNKIVSIITLKYAVKLVHDNLLRFALKHGVATVWRRKIREAATTLKKYVTRSCARHLLRFKKNWVVTLCQS